MATSFAPKGELQLLGEVATWFEPAPRATAPRSASGERVLLCCEQTGSIQVRNECQEPLGQLTRQVSDWLTPLLQANAVHVEGCIPAAATATARSARRVPLVLTVYSSARGQSLLEQTTGKGTAQALHDIVRRAYQHLQGVREPSAVEKLILSLRPLRRRALLPKTRLLLALLPGVIKEQQSAWRVRSMAEFRRRLQTVQLGDPLHWRGISLYPLAWPDRCSSPYTLFSEALARREALVEGASDQSSEPGVVVVNRAPRPTLICRGERLIGAGPDRVVSISVLVPPAARLVLPVSRVPERGGPCRIADEVDGRKPSDGHHPSGSSPLAGGDAAHPRWLEECHSRFTLPNGTAGVLVVCGGRVAALELFDSAETFGALWDRVFRRCFSSAMQWPVGSPNPNAEPVERFLDRLTTCARPRPALGLGEELAIASADTTGSALLYGNCLCHLTSLVEMR